MKIRSITYLMNPGSPFDSNRVEKAGRFVLVARKALIAAGFEVQTTRLATTPFPTWVDTRRPAALVELAQMLEMQAANFGLAYVALGPALPEYSHSYAAIVPAIRATQNSFFSASMSDAAGRISLAAVRACAEVIHAAAPLSPDGFANLRFAALANVRPGSPFFPAAHHAGERPAFALATEAADLAVEAFTNAASIEEARRRLVKAIESQAETLEKVALALAEQHNLDFGGIDFSLAPFPSRTHSLGEAMERLGLPAVGLHGSLAAAALLAETVDRARFRHAGFSGLMLPVLEDAVLAQRAAEGVLSVKDLLLFSAVCGTGLDTIPLAGDTSIEALYAVLLDLSVLAHRLDKPLTARLMPVPGKQVGDPTHFDFAFFADSRVMALEAEPLRPPLGQSSESFTMSARRPTKSA